MSADVGEVMLTIGAVVSRVIESLVTFDILFAASLYHAYTVLLPSPLLKLYETSAL